MSEQLLNGADVGAALEQVGGEGMAKGMCADVLREPGTANGHFDGFVDDAGINVMAAGHTRTRAYGQIPGGEHILPAPFLGGGGILPSQSMRQVHLAMPLSQILLMQRLDPGQVVLEQRGQGGGKGGEPVFVALAGTDGELLHLKIDVLDPEPDRFHDAQPAAVEELGDHLGGSVHERDNGGDFFACHDNGDVDLLVGANGIDAVLPRMVEDALVKEDQGIHRLVLGGGSDVCVYGEVGQERFDLGFGGEEVLTGPHAVETNKPHDPVHVGSLGVNGVVVQTEYLSDLIERGVLAVDFLSSQAYKTPIMIPRDR